jgi:hypothetical protein
MIQERAEARAQRRQEELNDEREEAEFEREMEAIRTGNSGRNSDVSSQFSESIDSWDENSQLNTDPLA